MDATTARQIISAQDITDYAGTLRGRSTLTLETTAPGPIRPLDFTLRVFLHTPARGRKAARYIRVCEACDGTGYRSEYANIAGGACFPCVEGGSVGKPNTLGYFKAMLRRRAATALVAAHQIKLTAQDRRVQAEQGRAAILEANPDFAKAMADFEALAQTKAPAPTATMRYSDDADEAAYHARREGMERVSPLLARLWADFQTVTHYRTVKPSLFLAEWDKVVARQQQAWVGGEGQTLTLEVTVTKVTPVETQYGYNNLIIATPTGNACAPLKWFSSAKWIRDLEEALLPDAVEAVTVTITGTVKAHEESDDYGRETMLARVKQTGPLVPVPAQA